MSTKGQPQTLKGAENKKDANAAEIENLKKYFRAANYLSVTQIFLQDNYLLQEPLRPEHIKSRLLGHWGTCPGISFVYTFLNRLARRNNAEILYVVGPGHGYPAVQANLFIEGTLGDYYPQATRDAAGVEYVSKQFSWPYGFPSHSSPHTPGVILEGGELGYSLSTSYGAVMDNPDLIVACLVGDGEAETAATATSWHCNKFLDPSSDGAVLPILHLNGYKISGPTVFGRMSDEELNELFSGYGYEVHMLDAETEDLKDPFEQMAEVTDACYEKIREIQKTFRDRDSESEISSEANTESKPPRWPIIILRTAKGWTGIAEIAGHKVEGNHYSHQVPVKEARIEPKQLDALEKWLRSYNFEELFDERDGFIQEILDMVPPDNLRIGKNRHAFGGPEVYQPLELPPTEKHSEDAKKPGIIGSSSMRRAGEYLNDVFRLNAQNKNFRFFSPDETYSNKLDKVFASTKRAWMWPMRSWDEDLGRQGRVIEMLSEHTLQGMMQGYVLTGRHGIFASYEAFIQIVASMCDQYAKFLMQAREVAWRGTIPSFNYILTSSGWRQEHNGFSHQNPGFIDNVLQRQGDFINVFFPADGNTTLAVMERVLSDTNGINVIVAGKTVEPRWRTVDEAKEDIEEGVSIWKFASDEDPDIVFVGVGDYVTKEALAALEILKKEAPKIRARFVNVSVLSYSGFGAGGRVISVADFQRIFTKNRPVIFNYHGYPQTVKQILFDYSENPSRFKVNGYIESGSTTTSFDMQARNKTSRYDLVIDAVRMLQQSGALSPDKSIAITEKYENKLREHREYIKNHGTDPEDIESWQWKTNI